MDGLSLLHLGSMLVDGWAQSDLEELFSSLDSALKGHDCSSSSPPFPPALEKGVPALDGISGFCSVLEM